jgi:geranylgeranyl pyrophosphate synthase
VHVTAQDVFTTLRPDLQRVEDRIEAVSRVDYPVVSSLVLDLVRSGGKRLRPLILLLAARGYGGDQDAIITAAAGVELLHTASLVHDDTIDRAALRRGKPTLNAQLSSGAVILLGDYLFAQSAMLAAATMNPRVVAIFAGSLGDICDGQLHEMFYAHRLDQSRADYEKRIFGKTAALFAAAAEMGAILGGASEVDVQSLRQYGADLGLAFQIIDDVLDLREGTQQLGKPAGNDLRQGTVTLPVMIYASGLPASSPERILLERLATGEAEQIPDAEIDALVDRIRASGALDETVAVAADFVASAKRHASVVPDVETREMLCDVADLALNRHS